MAFKRDRGVVTAIFHVCSGLLILHLSHQHLDAKIANQFPIGMYGWEPTFESLFNPYQSRYARGGIKKR